MVLRQEITVYFVALSPLMIVRGSPGRLVLFGVSGGSK